jgi:predicted anti-sigma-YlaC factor YlaD
MTCKEVNEFMADYLDGTLPWRQRLSFRLHLLICHQCRRYLASYAATVRIAHAAGQVAEQPVPDELVRAILAARGSRPQNKTGGQSPGAEP